MKTTLNLRALALSVFGLLTFTTYSQNQLRVNCYEDISQGTWNMVYLDSEIVEYACLPEPAFLVTVIDPATCSAWGTNYNGMNPDHVFGNYDGPYVRMRPEYYFAFRYAESSELDGMNNMLQQIPDGHYFVIYTPWMYDYALVSSNSPALAQTLANNWPADVQGDDILVLFGQKGNPASYVMQTDQNGTGDHGPHISFETTISCTLGLDEQAAPDVAVQYAGNGQWEITASGKIADLQLTNIAGQQIAAVREANTLICANAISTGIYIVSGTLNGKSWSKKVAVTW